MASTEQLIGHLLLRMEEMQAGVNELACRFEASERRTAEAVQQRIKELEAQNTKLEQQLTELKRSHTQVQQEVQAMRKERHAEKLYSQSATELASQINELASEVKRLTFIVMRKAKEAHVSCAEARQAGYSCDEAKQAGYSCAEVWHAGYKLHEMQQVGFSCIILSCDEATVKAHDVWWPGCRVYMGPYAKVPGELVNGSPVYVREVAPELQEGWNEAPRLISLSKSSDGRWWFHPGSFFTGLGERNGFFYCTPLHKVENSDQAGVKIYSFMDGSG
eukprot:3092857-Prymnesium_polylepis.1